jgi:hypothetical protein
VTELERSALERARLALLKPGGVIVHSDNS